MYRGADENHARQDRQVEMLGVITQKRDSSSEIRRRSVSSEISPIAFSYPAFDETKPSAF
jgi:hypothetical protein